MNRIQIVLDQMGISQDYLCQNLALNAAKVSRWCNNRSQPSWEDLSSISHLLRVDMGSLVYYEPVSISLNPQIGKRFKLDVIGSPDLFLRHIQGYGTLKDLTGIVLKIGTLFPDGSTKSNSIVLTPNANQNPDIPVITLNTQIQQCQFAYIEIEDSGNNPQGFQFLALRPKISVVEIVCPECDGYGSVGAYNASFDGHSLPPETTTCSECGGRGFLKVQYKNMTELKFAQLGLHNHHIKFRLENSETIYSGVLMDIIPFEEKTKNSEYVFVSTPNLRKYKEAENENDQDMMNNLSNKIDISEIVWARRVQGS